MLTRHIRAVHETKRPDVRKSRRRSCRRCAGFKIKCSGGGRGAGKNGAREGGRAEDPCEACKKRGAVCIYDFGNPVEEPEGSPKDDMLEFGSEASEEGTEAGGSKRRRVGERYESAFDEGIRRVSPHLLSAARMASESGSPDLRSGSSASAASLSNLISGDQAPELASADQIMSLMTTNTYVTIPSLDGSRPSSGSQTPQKEPVSVDMPVFGMKPQQPTKSPPMQPAIAPQSPGTLMYRRNDYFQVQKPSISANKRPEPLPLSPRDFRDNLNIPTKTLQGFPPVSPPSRSPPRHFPNVQASKSIDISSFVNDVQEESHRPRDYPVSFTVDYTQMNQKQGEIQQNGGNPQVGNLGSLVGQQGITGNIDVGQLGGSKPEDNNPGYINDLPDLENDDNWFFDFGIFDTTTDWLRGWGDDSSAQDLTGINGALPEHLSTVAPPPAGAVAPGRAPSPVLPLTSKPFVSPARPGSACSDEGSTTHCHKHRDDHQTRLPSVSPIKDLSSSSVEDFLPWGWQSGREEPKRRVTLPPLRQILEEYTPSATSQRTVSAPVKKNGLLSEEIRGDMIELLSIPYERYPYERADMSRFPTRKLLDGFLTLYFEQFHSNLPMIHRPTFSVATCPTIVLVSMASIGASYSELEGAKVFADTLSELCKRTLTWMAEYNPEYPRSDFFLKALCLQSVYALGSGSHRLYDSADVSRSFLIGNARRIGLFSGTISPPASSPSSTPNSPGQSNVEDTSLPRDTNEPLPLEARWNTWRKQEELKRLAWSIFEYDCSFSTLSNRRGAITLNDISTSMPCAEALWEAPNAQAWAALLEPKHSTQLPCAEKGKLFYPTLRDVISEKVSPDNLTSWGKRLCSQAMGRILWDFKELEESVLSVGGTSTGGLGNGGGLGLPMLSPGLKPAKETLLKSLMTLCESIQKKQMDTGMREGEVDGDRVHMILACLISHYTHLHAAFPTVSLILSLARRPPSSTESGVDPRITRLKTIFSTDPVYARTLAWNSAQIIAISRWKPVFSPVEGMRIFMAGVVLWGFGRYFREPNTNLEDIRTSPDSPTIRGMQVQIVRLDSHPWTRGIKGTGEYCPDEWIKNGGKKATIGNDDPDGNAMTEICSERGAKEVLKVVVGVLGRMRVWGLGGEFKSVLEEMAKRS